MSGSKANICGLKARFTFEASLVGSLADGGDDERWMVLMGLWWWWWWSWWSWWGCARHLAPRASSDHPPHRRTLSQSYWTCFSGLLCQCCPIDQTHWTNPCDSALMQSSDWIILSLSRKIGRLNSYTPPHSPHTQYSHLILIYVTPLFTTMISSRYTSEQTGMIDVPPITHSNHIREALLTKLFPPLWVPPQVSPKLDEMDNLAEYKQWAELTFEEPSQALKLGATNLQPTSHIRYGTVWKCFPEVVLTTTSDSVLRFGLIHFMRFKINLQWISQKAFNSNKRTLDKIIWD